jgi:hypothetical protein
MLLWLCHWDVLMCCAFVSWMVIFYALVCRLLCRWVDVESYMWKLWDLWVENFDASRVKVKQIVPQINPASETPGKQLHVVCRSNGSVELLPFSTY